MERRPRPPVARHAAAVAAALACAQLAGCGGHSNVQFASSGAPATGVSSGGSVRVQGTSTLGALFAIGVIAGASYASEHPRAMPARYVPPPMDPARRVDERDCTQPIEDWSANLKCR